MASLKMSQKSLTKYSTLYRWNGHFGLLSEVRKNINTSFGLFGPLLLFAINCSRSRLLREMDFLKSKQTHMEG
jgi:hypothetical protein